MKIPASVSVTRILPLLLIGMTGTALAEPPPISAFSRPPHMRAASLSMDGRYLAYIAHVDGQNVAFVMDVSDPRSAKPVLKPEKDSNIDLSWCRWGNDTRLVCGFEAALSRASGGRAYRTTKMAAVDADGGNVKLLMENLKVDGGQFRDEVIDWTPADSQTVLVQSMENWHQGGTFIKSDDSTPSVFKLDIYTGALSKTMPAQLNIRTFITDGNGAVRLGTGILDMTRVYIGRLLNEDQWRPLSQIELFDRKDSLFLMRVIPGTNKAHAMGASNGRRALWEVDLEDKQPPKLVFDHPQVDISYFEYERATGKVLGYWYDTDIPFFRYEDERLGSVMNGINKALPATFNRAVSFTDDFKKFIIHSISDVEAGTYYFYDATTRKLNQLGKAYPELDARSLGRMRSIEYPAEDGTLIPGYLTVPPGVRAEKLSLIVMPHDGPEERTYWRFDFLKQFLVSRGYAVLEMNFRGSAGYGLAWQQAAHQDWGGLPYSDIHAGTRWAIAQGIADPKRICIAGWGFGGYSALLGAARNSDTYKCAVSIASITDLLHFLDNRKNYTNDQIIKGWLGTDRSKLKRDSPAQQVKNIAIPILLVHGTHDATVPFEYGRIMARELKSAKKSYKFVEIEEADNSLWRPAERERLLSETAEFLKAHLGPGVVTP